MKCSVESGSACPLGPRGAGRTPGAEPSVGWQHPAVWQPGTASARRNAPGGESMNLTTVGVDISVRGLWEVALPDRGERVMCETLDEASRVAYRCAADRRPSELIVCDAHHRVVHRELIDVRERHGRAPRKAKELVPSSRSEPRLRGPIRQRQSRR